MDWIQIIVGDKQKGGGSKGMVVVVVVVGWQCGCRLMAAPVGKQCVCACLHEEKRKEQNHYQAINGGAYGNVTETLTPDNESRARLQEKQIISTVWTLLLLTWPVNFLNADLCLKNISKCIR